MILTIPLLILFALFLFLYYRNSAERERRRVDRHFGLADGETATARWSAELVEDSTRGQKALALLYDVLAGVATGIAGGSVSSTPASRSRPRGISLVLTSRQRLVLMIETREETVVRRAFERGELAIEVGGLDGKKIQGGPSMVIQLTRADLPPIAMRIHQSAGPMLQDWASSSSSSGADWIRGLTRDEAIARAVEHTSRGGSHELSCEWANKRPWGWLVQITTAKYLRTRNLADKVPGLGAVAVEHSGKVSTFPSSRGILAVREFEDARCLHRVPASALERWSRQQHVVWGTEEHGLQVGMAIPARRYRVGDVVDVRLFFRNTGQRAFQILLPSSGPGLANHSVFRFVDLRSGVTLGAQPLPGGHGYRLEKQFGALYQIEPGAIRESVQDFHLGPKLVGDLKIAWSFRNQIEDVAERIGVAGPVWQGRVWVAITLHDVATVYE